MRRYGLILTVCLLALAGCAKPRYFVSETMALGYVKRIVVLPFQNNTENKYAHERFRDVVTTEILTRGLFEIVEKGESQRFLQEELVRRDFQTLDNETAQRLGRDLGVEAYLAGSVQDFSEQQNGGYSYPVVAATLRLVDVKTGQIVWQVNDSESGYRTLDRLVGFASEDINQISYTLAKRMLSTLGGK